MPVYISLLRGINVGGNKIILMDDLRKLYEKLRLTNVRTYIQSGNVAFVAKKKNPIELGKLIKDGVKESFKFEVGVIVLELGQLDRLIAGNPFSDGRVRRGGRIYFTFLLQAPPKEKINELDGMKMKLAKASMSEDDFEIIGRTIYVLCRNGWSKSPFNSSITEKVLRVETTSRNLETIEKLAEIGRSLNSD